jgi:hypothetical protein
VPEPENRPDVPEVTDQPERADQPDEVAVEQPGKLLRIAVMIREMLEEVRRAPLDVDAREYLAGINGRVVEELRGALPGSLAEELGRIASLPADGEIPTEAQLRISQAQLLGWLEGLFQGIQAAIASQQMSMAAQLDEMRRRSLPEHASSAKPGDTPGQYL